MKYVLSLLAIAALAGAGCAQVSTTAEVETQAELEVSEGGSDEPTPVTLEVTTEEGVVVTEEGTTTDEDGVPVTEIILGEPADVTVDMTVTNFAFSPNVINASPGDEVQVNFNSATGVHTFTIDEIDINFSIAQGESLIFTTPDEPGEYAFYCDIGSHRSLGLEGTLIVE